MSGSETQAQGARPKDVVIVGAGPSGLTVAYRLAQQGIAATVLERESIPGGRTKVVQIAGEYVASGAGLLYVGGESEQMAVELGIEHHPVAPKTFSAYYNGATIIGRNNAQLAAGVPLSGDGKNELRSILDRITNEYWANSAHGLSDAQGLVNISWADYLGEMSPEVADFVHAISAVSCMVPSTEVAAKYALRYLVSKVAMDDDHASSIPQGMHQIALRLADKVAGQIQYDTTVVEVKEEDGRHVVVAKTKDGAMVEHPADAVVIAVPGPHVDDAMPNLPDWKREAINAVPSNQAVVLSVVLDKREGAVWDDLFFTATPGLPFDSICDCWFPTGQQENGRRTLEITAFGDRAREALQQSEEEITETWMSALEQVYPGAKEACLGTHAQKWWACFSLPKADRLDWLPKLQKPVGNVYFVGDYTSETAGTHGAIASGERAVAQILGSA